MSPVVLVAAAVAVAVVSLFLLRVSGAGRELFGRDAWMIRARHDADRNASSGRFIEDHAFWSLDPDADRDFWDEIPDDGDDDDGDADIAAAAGDH